LASHLKKTLGEIDQMPSTELTYWLAFDRIHPFEDAWEIGSLITSTLYNVMCGRKLDPDVFVPKRAKISLRTDLTPEDWAKRNMMAVRTIMAQQAKRTGQPITHQS
jgi:hypothetical protein